MSRPEISIFDLGAVIWTAKRWIVTVAVASGLFAFGISFLLPDLYQAQTLLAPAEGQMRSGNLSVSRGSIGTLASLPTLGTLAEDRLEENVAIFRSRQFITDFVDSENLMPILFSDDWNVDDAEPGDDKREQPSLSEAYRRIVNGGILDIARNRDNRLLVVTVEWTDPDIAAKWANSMVTQLNNFIRSRAIEDSRRNLAYLEKELERTHVAELRQAIFQLISEEQRSAMLANTREEYAFRVLDKAVAPDRRSSPNRLLIVLLSAFSATVAATVVVVVLSARKIWQDSDGKRLSNA